MGGDLGRAAGPDGGEGEAVEGGGAESGEGAEMLRSPYPLCEARP